MLSTDAEILLELVIQKEKREWSFMTLTNRAGPLLKKAKEQLSSTQTQGQNKTVVRGKKSCKLVNELESIYCYLMLPYFAWPL